MFWRILWRLLWASRSRLALALVSVASGAAVCAALLNLNLDAGRKLTREFRALGANVIISAPRAADRSATLDSGVLAQINTLEAPEIVAAVPFLYVAAEAGDASQPVPLIVAGTAFEQAARINTWWQVEGRWPVAGGSSAGCLVGISAARRLGLVPGRRLTVRHGSREAALTVEGVVTAGGSEDSQVLVDLGVAQQLAGLPGRVGLVQVSVQGQAPEIEGVMARLAAALPGREIRPVRQLAEAEGRLFERIQGLLFASVLVILVLSGLGVLAAMAGLAIERRPDVALMKALGGSVREVMRFFLAEAAAIGLVGGLAGWAAGMWLSGWVGERVFAAAVAPRLLVLPVTLGLMVLVALAGALPLRLLGRVRPAEILRGE